MVHGNDIALTSSTGPRPGAETEKAAQAGQAEPPRVTLRRHVAATAARSEPEFFAVLARGGVQVRLRHSEHDPGQVTGYAVTCPGPALRPGSWCGLAAGSGRTRARRPR